MSGPVFDRYKLEASIYRESFWEFLRGFWDVVIKEKPIWNWHMQYLANLLQKMAERVMRNEPKLYDLVGNVPPGTSKSTIFSVMFPAWFWTRMPSARLIVVTHTFNLGLDLSRKCRDVIRSPLYQSCFPEIKMRDDQDTKQLFVNTKGGSRYVSTVGGASPTGFHSHFILVDDPIDPKRSLSEVEIKTANTYLDETLFSRKANKLVVPTALIMQRLHQNDPTGHLLELAGRGAKVFHVCFPAEESDNIKPAKMRKYYRDGLLDPILLPRQVLEEARSRGEFSYAGQYMQNPIPLEGAMFHTDRLNIEHPPPVTDFVSICRYWDKAGSDRKNKRSAWTVGVKMGKDRKGRIWVLDVVRGRWESAARERVILATARIDGEGVEIGMEQEPGSGGKESVESSIRSLIGFRVRADRPTGDKVIRADPFSTQVNGGNVSIAIGPWNQEYIQELAYFPNSTYLDQVDASSGAFKVIASRKMVVGGLGARRRAELEMRL